MGLCVVAMETVHTWPSRDLGVPSPSVSDVPLWMTVNRLGVSSLCSQLTDSKTNEVWDLSPSAAESLWVIDLLSPERKRKKTVSKWKEKCFHKTSCCRHFSIFVHKWPESSSTNTFPLRKRPVYVYSNAVLILYHHSIFSTRNLYSAMRFYFNPLIKLEMLL